MGGPASATTTTTSAASTLARANTRDPTGLLEAILIADAVQEVGRGLGKVNFHAIIIVDDGKVHSKFPPLDSMQEVAHLDFSTQATVRRGGLLEVGSPGLEA